MGALSYLHTMYLSRRALQKTLEHYPRERQLVQRSYRSLCLMRGMVFLAKEIVQERKRAKRLEAGQDGDDTPRKQDFLDRIGTRRPGKGETDLLVAPSVALQSRVGAREVSLVIQD